MWKTYVGVWACTALMLSGCGGGGGGQYSGPWAQVSGKVNLGDSPCSESATVLFMSAEGHTASGELTNGEFKLKYNGGNNIPVAKYTVGISPKIAVAQDITRPEDAFNADGTTKKFDIPVSKIPAKYHQPGSSGISIEVVEGTNDQISIDLDLK